MDKQEVLRTFPIRGLLEGWYFRQDEVSNGHYVAEGTDLWGRKVNKEGPAPEGLLEACAEAARRLQQQLAAQDGDGGE